MTGMFPFPFPSAFVDLAAADTPAEPRPKPWPKDPDAPKVIHRNTIAFAVSHEMALDYGLIEPTPEEAAQRAADLERWRTEYAEAVRVAWATYDTALEQLATIEDPTVRAVLDLHAPVEVAGGVYCHGCDAGGYDWTYPKWPCRTVAAIGTNADVPLPDGDDLDLDYDRETKTYRRPE